MKKGWEYKELGEVAKICGGKRLPKGCKLQSEPTKHKYIRVADFLDNGTVCKDDIQYISDDIFNQIKRYTISSADVYISIAGTIGKSGIVPDELNGANLTENACKLVLNKELDKRFVYLVTISPFFKEQINTLTKKSAQPKLALTRLATVNVPVPPLSEQKEIVEYLDSSFAKIDKLKENAAKNLEEAKALFQSALKDALEPKEGWEEKTLEDICDFIRGPFGGSLKKECFKERGYAVYEQQNAIYNRFTFRYYIDEVKYQSMIRFKVNPGDLIMSCSGTIGKVAIIPQNAEAGIINQALLKLTPHKEIKAHYLKYLMESKYFEEIINANIEGVAIKNIASVATLKKIAIVIPSISEQQSIVSFLDSLNEKVNTLQQNYSRICDECDALKQAILRQVFE